MDIGFIGLGQMGRAMAMNLVKAGHRLRVWNRSPEAARDLVAAGAVLVGAPTDAFGGEAVISMLADDAATRSILLDAGLVEAADRATIHVNMATISVGLARELAARHARAGSAYVAAPVFGRPDVAAAGQLNILAAGDPAAVERVAPLLGAMGQKTWPLGAEPHRANAVKLAGNMMIGIAIEAMGEATALARAHGVAAADLIEILSSTLFAAPVYKTYGALIAADRYEPAAFPLRLGLKDMRLVLAAGDDGNVPLPFASVLRDRLLAAIAQGDGDKDFSALARLAHRQAGLDG